MKKILRGEKELSFDRGKGSNLFHYVKKREAQNWLKSHAQYQLTKERSREKTLTGGRFLTLALALIGVESAREFQSEKNV